MMVSFGRFHIGIMLADNGFLCVCQLVVPSEDNICAALQSTDTDVVRAALGLEGGIRLLRRYLDILDGISEATPALLALVSEKTAAEAASIHARRAGTSLHLLRTNSILCLVSCGRPRVGPAVTIAVC